MEQLQRVEALRTALIGKINPILTTALCLMEFKEDKLDVPYKYDGKVFTFDSETFKSVDDKWITDHLTVCTVNMATSRYVNKKVSRINHYNLERMNTGYDGNIDIANIDDIDDSFNHENYPTIASLLDSNQTSYGASFKIRIKHQSNEAIIGTAYYNCFTSTKSYEPAIVYKESNFYAILDDNGKWKLTSVAAKKIKELADSIKLVNKLTNN